MCKVTHLQPQNKRTHRKKEQVYVWRGQRNANAQQKHIHLSSCSLNHLRLIGQNERLNNGVEMAGFRKSQFISLSLHMRGHQLTKLQV